MRNLFIGLTTVALLQGCSTIKREAGYPGGNVGYLADRHALFAKGHEQQVNRYLVTLALLTPLIAETVGTSSEAKLSAERIKTLYKNIDKLEKASIKCSLPDLPSQPVLEDFKFDLPCEEKDAKDSNGTALVFESMSFDVNKSLSDALKQAFDNLEIKSNASRVLALEPREMLKTILKARRLVPVLLKYLSTYRDVTIVFGLSVAESCSTHDEQIGAKDARQEKSNAISLAKEALQKARDGKEMKKITKAQSALFQAKATTVPKDNITASCDLVVASFDQLLNRKRTENSDLARLERPISNVFSASEKALNNGLDWKVSKVNRISLLQHVNRACKKLDALAKIEHEGFVGCQIDTKGSSIPAKPSDDTMVALEVQEAAHSMVNNVPDDL